jgi:Flp pilus assembly protein TadD
MSVETADTAFHKGNSLFVDELFEDAMKYYNTAIELEGDNAEFWIKRSACHFQLKNFAGTFRGFFSHLTSLLCSLFPMSPPPF